MFENNIASEEGGAIKWSEKKPEFKDVEYKGNQAVYGPNIAAFPLRLRVIIKKKNIEGSMNQPLETLFISDDNSEIYKINNIVSGSPMEVDLDVEIVDSYNQTIKTLNKG
jgi:hypothetical protein